VPPPAVVDVAAGVETETDGLTEADAAALLLPTPASEAALPAPPALADVPGPLLFAEALPSAKALAAALPLAVVDASELESITEEADAEPSPTEVAATFAVADDDAVAVPSLLVAELPADAAAVPLIDPPPLVLSSMSASASDDEFAVLTSDDAPVVAWANALPTAVPSPVDVPLRAAWAVAPSSVKAEALAAPDAEAPVPEVARSTCASAEPDPNVALVVPRASASSVTSSPVVGSVLPVALALVDTLESAELPSVPALCAEALPFAEADAPAPVALPVECELELAAPPPAVAWLSDEPLADAA
jgi:hypothetical protein